ncbi:MAG: hypothetical protein HFJ49_03330 [Clostridia bacterium]|nr:hypothetical protein [Clostridia bacterium]
MKSLFKFVIITVITLIFIYAFTPSYMSRGMENLAYVVGIGIDKNTENDSKMKVSFQFVQLYALGESGSTEPPPTFIDSVTSNSINSAINQINAYIGKEINLSHCDIIVFSNDFAKDGISTEIYSLVNNEDIRPSANLVISTATASSYLESVKPNIEKLVTKYYDTFPITSAFTGYTQDITIGKFYNRLVSDCWDNTVALGEVFSSEDSSNSEGKNENSSESNESSGSQSENSSESTGSSGSQSEIPSESSGNSGASSGSSSSQSENSNEQPNSENSSSGQTSNSLHVTGKRDTQNVGVAVFKDDTLIGQLSEIETICHLLILDEVKSSMISVPNINSNENANNNTNLNTNKNVMDLSISPRTKPKISIDISRTTPIITIDLFLDANILTVDQSSNYVNSKNLNEISSATEKFIEENMNLYLNKVSKELKADVDGFARYAIRKFLTEDDWYSYNWQEQYEKAEFIVNSNVNVTSSLLLTELK